MNTFTGGFSYDEVFTEDLVGSDQLIDDLREFRVPFTRGEAGEVFNGELTKGHWLTESSEVFQNLHRNRGEFVPSNTAKD